MVTKSDMAGVIPLILGVALLYFNITVKVCTGWSAINPLCWVGSFATNTLLLLGGIVLIIMGVIKLIK